MITLSDHAAGEIVRALCDAMVIFDAQGDYPSAQQCAEALVWLVDLASVYEE